MNLFLAVIFGIGFGYILYRAGALDYRNIINALTLKDLSIPKFMLLSVAITSVGIYSLRLRGLVSLDVITANPLARLSTDFPRIELFSPETRIKSRWTAQN